MATTTTQPTPLTPGSPARSSRASGRGLGLDPEKGDLGVAGGSSYVYRRIVADPADPTAAPGARPALLPIGRGGAVRIDLEVPDRLAHEYDLAVEPLRRYDRAWSRVEAAARPAAAVLPYEAIRPIAVARSRPLREHNVIATPLPGSVQAYVYAHPAEFASTSSALYAKSLQYSGQDVTLERRIPSRREVVDTLRSPAIFPFDWERYAAWVTASGIEPAPDGPPLVLTPPKEDDPTAYRLIPVTRSGLYGADRYVYPDMPGYYEYRVVATSTAGLRVSPPAASAFVAPLYDLERQRPRTRGVGRVTFDAAAHRVDLELHLVHPRQHLRDEMAGLWVACDEEIALPLVSGSAAPAEPRIKYGSLPDLFLAYNLFLRSNYAPGPRARRPCSCPWCQSSRRSTRSAGLPCRRPWPSKPAVPTRCGSRSWTRPASRSPRPTSRRELRPRGPCRTRNPTTSPSSCCRSS